MFNLLLFFFFFLAQSHVFNYIYGCFESGDVRVDILVDEDEAIYADFSREEVVWGVPHLPLYVKDLTKRAYDIAKAAIGHCHSVMDKAKKADPGVPLRKGTEPGTVYSDQCSFNTWRSLTEEGYKMRRSQHPSRPTLRPTEDKSNQKALREDIL